VADHFLVVIEKVVKYVLLFLLWRQVFFVLWVKEPVGQIDVLLWLCPLTSLIYKVNPHRPSL